MQSLLDLFHRVRDVNALIAWGGYVGLTAIIFAETGLLIGFFLPGDSLLFNKKHLYRAHEFYEKYGGMTVILARFMPIVRTFVPVVAGMAQMGYRRYTLFNLIGGIGWIWSMLFIGYFLGRYIPGVDRHIETVIVLVILISLLPGIIGWMRTRKREPASAAQ